MALQFSDQVFQTVEWTGALADDDIITITLETERYLGFEYGNTTMTRQVVFRSTTSRDKWRANGNNHWFVLDKDLTNEYTVWWLYNRPGSRIFENTSFWRRLFASGQADAPEKWAMKHVEFGIRPFYENIQRQPGWQFVLGGELYIIPVIDQKKIYKNDFREGFFLDGYTITDITTSKAPQASSTI